MNEKSDAQVLAEAMGIEFHDCGYEQCELATRFTDPSELWELLQYMMGRRDWEDFFNVAWVDESVQVWADKYVKWLLSDPARFVRLCADWCREHTKKGGAE